MKRCWQESPDSRPRFARMVDELGDMLMTRCDYIQFDGKEDETEVSINERKGRLLLPVIPCVTFR